MRLPSRFSRLTCFALPFIVAPSLLGILLLSDGTAAVQAAPPPAAADSPSAPAIAPGELDLESWEAMRRTPTPTAAETADDGSTAGVQPTLPPADAELRPAQFLLTVVNESDVDLTGVFMRSSQQDRLWGLNALRSGPLAYAAQQVLVSHHTGECELLIVDADGRYKAARLLLEADCNYTITILSWGWKNDARGSRLATYDGPWSDLNTVDEEFIEDPFRIPDCWFEDGLELEPSLN